VEHPYPPDKVDLEAAYGPVVARDGRTVWFRTRTPSTDWQTHEYDLATGTLRVVDGARVRAAVEDGRAVPLGAITGDRAPSGARAPRGTGAGSGTPGDR
jgi:hypothetical protein